MARILIVEDEPNMLMGLQDNLEFEGYVVDTARQGREGWEKAREGRYDLVILDIMLPGISGYDICRNMRQAGIQTPVIFLSAKGEEIDKVLGLELGADDYMTKPFGLRELLARVKAILRRNGNPGSDPVGDAWVHIGLLEVDFKSYLAKKGGQEVKMSHKEMEVLRYLWEHKNHPVSRVSLLREVWLYDTQPSTRTVDNFILKLRQKVEEDPAQPKWILTVHGLGYKLLGSLTS